ncbi:uncharacterized protein TRAVEDRAFT_56409 [Trametes versicolor FP-101664 SS1]|uniref:uncharacterized protein n=1 Tax=Trametes versicolor (strain FP-101664) TaxID=717944 RepID=UPI0004622445|nr:uncharacterized protein TRAVEDRAFT_56409 [Trametes versicolor FP-101664 SS1]EIW63379.1 hypothetical protein TRAVEDRAFT_56409 [Trametes versicolor FP-101664 SS1]
MDSFDLSNLQMPQSGSQLLAEPTPDISSSSSRTGHGGDDLSLSELSLSERAQSKPGHRRPFSLLARPESPDESAVADGDAEESEEPDMDGTMTQEDLEKARKLAAKTREEKLQHDLFTLKKLNAAFEVYKEALRETKSNTDLVAVQLQHTNALLDKYVRILDKSEKITKLILDERWQGAEADEEQLDREEQEAEERAQREEEERILAEQRERERREREQREREEKELRERLEREKAETAKSVSRGSGVRGVRGTRASMRGLRGVSRVAAPTPSTRGIPRGGTTTGSGGSGIRRPATTSSTRASATSGRGGIPRRT